AEDGIRDKLVTGVQTCALPICCIPALWIIPMRTRTTRRAAFGFIVRRLSRTERRRRNQPDPGRVRTGNRSFTPQAGSKRGAEDRSEERRVGKEGRATRAT